MGTIDFLIWIHERLEYVHKENPHADYMHKLRNVILSLPSNDIIPNVGIMNNLDDLKAKLEEKGSW